MNQQKSFVIAGHSVYFPYQPYPSQFAMMDKVIKALSKKENALLESATGTGKSLALLCGALAWQTGEKERMRNEQLLALQPSLPQQHNLLQTTAYSQQTDTQSSQDSQSQQTQTQSTQQDQQTTQQQIQYHQTTPQYMDSQEKQHGYGCEGTGPPNPSALVNNNNSNNVDNTNALQSSQPSQQDLDGHLQQSSQSSQQHQLSPSQPLSSSQHSQPSQPIEQETPLPPQPPKAKPKKAPPVVIANDDDDDFMPMPALKKTPAKRKEKKPIKPTKSTPKGKKAKKDDSIPPNLSTTPPPLPLSDKSKPGLPPVKAPTIYFGTRTHAQVAQLVSELERTFYRPKMSVLAARDHYCIHPTVSKSATKNSDCKKIVLEENCKFDKGTGRLAKSGTLVDAVWDIEDLVKLGTKLTGCPYYAARNIAKSADIVFCPYNYIVDPEIRETLGIDLDGAAVIFDEAHNIEDITMSVASGDFDLVDLNDDLLKQLTSCTLMPEFHDAYGPTQNLVACIVDWMHEAIQSLKPTDFESHTNYWSGDEFVAILARGGVTIDSFSDILESVHLIEELSTPISNKPGSLRTAKSMTVLLDLMKVLKFLFSEGLSYTIDFRVVIQKASRHFRGKSIWTHTLGIWCLSPRVAFKALEKARATILTSGTLSPMDSYASELGANFEHKAELGHVIDTSKQLWAAAISRGPGGQPIKAVFQNADSLTAQDVIGDTIFSFLSCIPGGVLCFFPSYAFMDKLVARWQMTGLWARMQSLKEMLVEPKGTSDFSPVLSAYYKAADSSRGASLLAVCRGKVSEGMDFTDHYARGVIVVGIPYPSAKDLRVVLKRTYNDQNQIAKGLIDGRSWYSLQAFRALNQALGRCIRHKNDFGSIILIDERFCEQAVIGKLSKWVRGNVRIGASVEQATTSLKSFFETHKQ